MAWNVFKFCTALRALGSIMIVFVMGIIGVTYYAVVIANYGPSLLHGGCDSFVALSILFFFHFLLVMLLWSYFSVVVTDPGGVPPDWRPELDSEKGDTDQLVSSGYSGVDVNLHQTAMLGGLTNQKARFCRKCNQHKPPRCHHCSVCGIFFYTFIFPLFNRIKTFTGKLFKLNLHYCIISGGRCILKMDHHCVWVVNCVGALNYKFFLLFLFYTFLETTLVTLSLLPVFAAFFSDGEISGSLGTLLTTFITFVLNLAFALSVMGFLIMHISLVAANTTTIEAYEKKTTPRWRYDIGRKKNFEQVLGIDKRYWFIPAYSKDDLKQMSALQGLEYPMIPEMNLFQL